MSLRWPALTRLDAPRLGWEGVNLSRPAVELAIRGPLTQSDLPGLCRRACAALAGAADGVLVCDVTGVPVDAVAVDALARLAVGARRQGCRVALRGATAELRELLALTGLEEVLGT